MNVSLEKLKLCLLKDRLEESDTCNLKDGEINVCVRVHTFQTYLAACWQLRSENAGH